VENTLIFGLKTSQHEFLQRCLFSAFAVLAQEITRAIKSGEEQPIINAHVRLMVLAAYSLLGAGLDQQPETRKEVRDAIGRIFPGPKKLVDMWRELTTPKSSLALGIGTQVIGRYHDLWLYFQRRIENLPKVVESMDDRISFSERADHPSLLVQRLSRHFSWDVEDLIEELAKDFEDTVRLCQASFVRRFLYFSRRLVRLNPCRYEHVHGATIGLGYGLDPFQETKDWYLHDVNVSSSLREVSSLLFYFKGQRIELQAVGEAVS
jgi:hypothetical protein